MLAFGTGGISSSSLAFLSILVTDKYFLYSAWDVTFAFCMEFLRNSWPKLQVSKAQTFTTLLWMI